jgi:hypothetical protein
LAIETGYRVRDSGGADKSGLLPVNTSQWTETGLTPNTQYARWVYAANDCGESDPSGGRSVRTLSVPPDSASITRSPGTPAVNGDIVWTAVGGFGAGIVQYYLYAWDQNSMYTWTGLESQWSSGTITTSPTAPGIWYLHVQGYNGDGVPNGSYDYELAVGAPVAADLDNDSDVDEADFALFDSCFSGPAVPTGPGCENRDFDGDVDVDNDDFGVFQRCYSGENNPADASCAD